MELLEKTFDSDSDDGLIYVRPYTETVAKSQTKTKTDEPTAEEPCWICGKTI